METLNCKWCGIEIYRTDGGFYLAVDPRIPQREVCSKNPKTALHQIKSRWDRFKDAAGQAVGTWFTSR